MSNITTTQIIEIISNLYGESSAAEGAEYADQNGYKNVEEFFSLAMSKILYSDMQLQNGERFAVESGSLDDLI